MPLFRCIGNFTLPAGYNPEKMEHQVPLHAFAT